MDGSRATCCSERRQELIDAALELAHTSGTPALQVRTIGALTHHLPLDRVDELIESALQLCREMEDDRNRVNAFSELAMNLPEKHLSEAATIARNTKDEQWRNQMLAEVAMTFAELDDQIARWRSSRNWKIRNWRTDTLRRIGPSIKKEDDIVRALQMAAIPHSGYLVRTYTTFQQGGKQISQMHASLQAAAIAPLAARVTAELKPVLHDLWKETVKQMAGDRTEILLSMRDLNQMLRGLAGNAVSAEVGRAVRDAIRWWP